MATLPVPVLDDGYLRRSIHEIQHLPLQHLLSVLDEAQNPDHSQGATATSISGYTEWLAWSGPSIITLGWDWLLNLTSGRPILIRVGDPRSNLMVVDTRQRIDMGHARTHQLLSQYIDEYPWQDTAMREITRRYTGPAQHFSSRQ